MSPSGFHSYQVIIKTNLNFENSNYDGIIVWLNMKIFEFRENDALTDSKIEMIFGIIIIKDARG